MIRQLNPALLLIPFFLWVYAPFGWSQSSVSSYQLWQILQNESLPDTARMAAGIRLQKKYKSDNYDSIVPVSRYMEQYGRKVGNREIEGYAWAGYGLYYYLSENLDSSRVAYKRAEALCPDTTLPLYPLILFGQGNIVWNEGMIDSAIYFFNKALSYAVRYGTNEVCAGTHNNLGAIYLDQKKFIEALDHFEASQKVGSPYIQATSAFNIATIFKGCGMFDLARENYRKAFDLAEKSGHPGAMGLAYTGMISLGTPTLTEMETWVKKGLQMADSTKYYRLKIRMLDAAGYRYVDSMQYDKAERYFHQAIDIGKQLDQEKYYNDLIINMAYIKEKKGEHRNALLLCKQVQYYYEKNNINSQLYRLYAIISEAFEGLKQVDSALYYRKLSDVHIDPSKDVQLTKTLLSSYLQKKHDEEKALIQLEKANAEALAREMRKRHLMSTWLFIVISLLLSGIALFYYFYYRQKKQAAEALSIERQKLLRSNEKLRRFSGIVSHDILSNLDLILSTGNILVASKPQKESLVQYFNTTHKTSRQLKNYCLNLLEEARSTSTIHPALANPQAVFNTVRERMEPAIRKSNLQIVADRLSPTSLPTAVVEQIFQNMISNAVNHAATAPKPVLKIMESIHTSGQVQWIFEDNGPGMPNELYQTIFTHDRIQSTNGNGMGLKLLYATLQYYSANIFAEQNPAGSGARFIITLPITQLHTSSN